MSTVPSSVSSFASQLDSSAIDSWFSDADVFHFPMSLRLQQQQQEQPPQPCAATSPPTVPASQMRVNIPVVPKTIFGLAPVPDVCSPPQDQKLAAIDGCPEWLPNGWIMEVKTRKSGSTTGMKYKCYIDPASKSKFYSKSQVSQYLKSVNQDKCTSKQDGRGIDSARNLHIDQSTGCKSSLNQEVSQNLNIVGGKSCTSKRKKIIIDSSSTENVVIEKVTAEGLPPGWIKEIKIQKKANGIRKDLYYTDSKSGYIFRSKMDALRFLETGDVNSCVIKPTKRPVNDLESINYEILHDTHQSIGCDSPLKPAVTQNLKTVTDGSCGSKEKKVVIERAVAGGLPVGWIKEIRIQRKANRIRKDPYYTDPVSGYVFRSKMDALRFLETGDINSCAIKPTKKGITDLDLTDDKILSQPASTGLACATGGQLFGDLGACDISRLGASDAQLLNKRCKNRTAGATVASILVAKYLEEHWHINLLENCTKTKESSDWNSSTATGFRHL